MAEIVLFHHAHGRTDGVVEFGRTLQEAGHVVHLPDLYDGKIFDDLEAAVGHAQDVGFNTIIDRGVSAVQDLPEGLVYAGFSLGVLPAQKLAQTRPGAAGALLMHSCVPPSSFGGPWPAAVPVQIHGAEDDEFFVGDGDIDAARDIVATTERAELFLYPGDGHLFADNGLAAFDPGAARLLTERVLTFLTKRS